VGKRLADVEALERSLASRGGVGLRLTVRGARCSARWKEGPFSTAAALRGVEVSIQVRIRQPASAGSPSDVYLANEFVESARSA
jgi:hypothetical protein